MRAGDDALYAARETVIQMLRGRPGIRDRLERAGVKVSVLARSEELLDVPENAHLRSQSPPDSPGETWNERARAISGTPEFPNVNCSEENLRCEAPDAWRGEDTLVHEFGHTMANVGLVDDVEFRNGLRAAYVAALSRDLWNGTFAIRNEDEYWAEGTQDWYDVNLCDDWQHNAIHTRDQVRSYDPQLWHLLSTIYLDDGWRPFCAAQRKQCAR
jgi:hypothetical protein